MSSFREKIAELIAEEMKGSLGDLSKTYDMIEVLRRGIAVALASYDPHDEMLLSEVSESTCIQLVEDITAAAKELREKGVERIPNPNS